MKYALLALALAGPLVFPWPLAALLAIIAAFPFPFTPLLVGGLLDTLYLPPDTFPLATALGILAALVAFFVHRSLEAGMMRG